MAGRGESPAVARRRVRLALRRAREATGLSQGAVADRVGWSVSKVQRIESGDNAISATDLRALLDLYGIGDPEEIDQLAEEARISRRQRWWAKPEFREHLTPASMQLLQFEAEAVAIRTYQPVVVPGVMQTPAYAEALIRDIGADLGDDARRVRVEARMQRRAQIIESEEGPEYRVILDESALHRDVAPADVMADQFDRLVAYAGSPRIDIRVMPLNEGGYLGVVGQFTLLDLSDDDPDDAVLYRESFMRDSIDHDPKEVAFHRRAFETFWGRSLDKDKSIRAIAAAAATLRTRADRQ